MFGNKRYELTLAKNYVSKWGVPEAVREIIQNALDSESPFVYSFFKMEGVETYTLKINSEFTNLQTSTLLLGKTSKADNTKAIGSFGEGYKIALLVLTRLGYDVDMINGDLLWKPSFQFNSNFGEELLVIDEIPANDHVNHGLTFFIHGLDEAAVTSIRSSCLQMQEYVGQIYTTAYGDILLERPGELYVGGLYICKTEMHFGYNIKPEYITLERDRQTVSSWDLRVTTKNMWFDTRAFEKIAELIEAETPDVEYAEYGSSEMVKEACYRLFRAKHPGKVIAKNNTEMEHLIKQGMTVYVGGGAFYSNVSSAPQYRKEQVSVVAVATPEAMLKEWFKKNRSEMRSKAIESFKRDILEVATNWRKM